MPEELLFLITAENVYKWRRIGDEEILLWMVLSK